MFNCIWHQDCSITTGPTSHMQLLQTYAHIYMRCCLPNRVDDALGHNNNNKKASKPSSGAEYMLLRQQVANVLDTTGRCAHLVKKTCSCAVVQTTAHGAVRLQ